MKQLNSNYIAKTRRQESHTYALSWARIAAACDSAASVACRVGWIIALTNLLLSALNSVIGYAASCTSMRVAAGARGTRPVISKRSMVVSTGTVSGGSGLAVWVSA